MKLVSTGQMRSLDSRSISEAGIPGEVLMERAGLGAAEHILDFAAGLAPEHARRFVVLAGRGNNGGDGHVVTRHLRRLAPATPAVVYSSCGIAELSGDALLNAKRLPPDAPLIVKQTLARDDFKEGDIVIDALLGIGAKGPLRPPFDQWINFVNGLELPVIALDVPSGLDGDDGSAAPSEISPSGRAAIVADMTITMGLPKTGLTVGQGAEISGRIRLVDIGIPAEFVAETASDANLVLADDVAKFFGRIPAAAHKNSRGTVLVVGGSRDYPGAPLLAAKAALRSGAGLVFAATPETGLPIDFGCLAVIPRLIEGNGRAFSKKSILEMEKLLASADAVVIGNGMTTDTDALPVLDMVLDSEKPKVIDADALNLLAANPRKINAPEKAVLTPHPGEMKRLLDGFGLGAFAEKSRPRQAAALSEKTGATIALKGRFSVTASPLDRRIFINSSGSPAIAKAGSGDVLAGVIGALLACRQPKPDFLKAVRAAVFIHGLAGELTPFGARGLLADDLVDLIPAAVKKISPLA